MRVAGGEDMGHDRADELVLAGSRPSQLNMHNMAFVKTHRANSFVLIIDLALVYIFNQMLLEAMIGGAVADFLSSVVGVLFFIIWLSYRRQRKWAFWPAAAAFALASIVFFAYALINLGGVLSGGAGGLLWGGVMVWVAYNTFRRFKFHLHPSYRAAYEREDATIESELNEGEMLAACPSCMAVLAIRPDMLSSDDHCPHCDAHLVSPELFAKYQGGRRVSSSPIPTSTAVSDSSLAVDSFDDSEE